jgi:DNA helicase-2/ATP-dependent DNA helicase PcrA
MIRRAERIVRTVIGQSASSVTEALNWAGTFHAIGARLLRVYADQIGLDPAYTIHDREDSADLLNLVRHQLGFSKLPVQRALSDRPHTRSTRRNKRSRRGSALG